MSNTDELFDSVANVVRKYLLNAETLHLSSVAKSIESIAGCRIFIERFDESELDHTNACLLTREIGIVTELGLYPERNYDIITTRDHFIFYRPCPQNPDLERQSIAHELGHCVLHWPLKDEVEFTRIDMGQHDAYHVRFPTDQEKEADAFACVLATGRPRPDRPSVDDDFIATVIAQAKESWKNGGFLKST